MDKLDTSALGPIRTLPRPGGEHRWRQADAMLRKGYGAGRAAVADKLHTDPIAKAMHGLCLRCDRGAAAVILDELSARPEKAKELGVSRIRNLLGQATHFVLDEYAAEQVRDMVENNAVLIGELQEFALRPFDQMTLTMPMRMFGRMDREALVMLDSYKGINAYALVLRDTRTGNLVPIPGWYGAARHRPDETSRTVIRLDDAMSQDEERNHQIGVYSLAIDATMLFLNQKKGVHVSEPTMRRKSLLRGRPVTYFSRSTITLTLNAPAIMRHHYQTLARSTPRRHGVRGHFFHRGGDLACEHRWARLEDFENGWECVDCDRRRFWRRDFERGDEHKGITVATYKIGASA